MLRSIFKSTANSQKFISGLLFIISKAFLSVHTIDDSLCKTTNSEPIQNQLWGSVSTQFLPSGYGLTCVPGGCGSHSKSLTYIFCPQNNPLGQIWPLLTFYNLGNQGTEKLKTQSTLPATNQLNHKNTLTGLDTQSDRTPLHKKLKDTFIHSKGWNGLPREGILVRMKAPTFPEYTQCSSGNIL